jgi:hypothetical protein
VLGADIVGTCRALQLRLDSHEVRLIDWREPGTAISFGKTNIISAGSIMPYATPSLWKAAPSTLTVAISGGERNQRSARGSG